ncbi:MAG TPA: nitronate monooxygenase, partial [Holophagaceae bacterium]|nr:nitronate monooxygenase [Holophagaceae bacterium]
MSASALTFLGRPELPLFQGWYPEGGDTFAQAWAECGGAALLRLPAFPDAEELRQRLRRFREGSSGCFGLDLRGVLGPVREALEVARQDGASFVLQGVATPARVEADLEGCPLPRIASVEGPREAAQALAQRIEALIVEGREGWQRWMEELRSSGGRPLLARVEGQGAAMREWIAQGMAGFQLRSPRVLREGEGLIAEFRRKLAEFRGAHEGLAPSEEPLPRLRIRNLDITYPIVQGGMGVGVSWAGLAGAVARSGCVGTVSAIGTAYGHPEGVKFVQGRPHGASELNHGPALKRILADALRTADGRGPVAINALCAIHDYDRVVREALEGGAQMVISGAGLPLNLPELTKGSDAALVPIVSSARALKLLCRTWERRHGRLPDAVVLEGPESGGHQGYSPEQCADPAFALEATLPQILEERDRWGSFPVLVAGGVWDGADIRRFLAMGAS